jgi:energy-coupling factor transporter transmembrane protein EcfT
LGFCLLSFFLQSKSVLSSNKSLFGNVFLLSIFFKLILCGLLVIAYALIAKPSSVHFILPFFVIYLFYTVFEVYFILKLAKS